MMRHRSRYDGVALLAILVGALGGHGLSVLLFDRVGVRLASPMHVAVPPIEVMPPAPARPSVAFSAGSLEPHGFSVSGLYEGWVGVGPNGTLEARVPHARLRVLSDRAAGTRETLVGIRLEVAAETGGGGWTTVRSGPLVRLDRIIRAGDRFELGDLLLTLPDVVPAGLEEGSWLVLTHELDVRSDDPNAYSGPAFTYVHMDREVVAEVRTIGTAGWR